MAALCCIPADAHTPDSSASDLPNSCNHIVSVQPGTSPKKSKHLSRSKGATHLVNDARFASELHAERDAILEFHQIFQLRDNSSANTSQFPSTPKAIGYSKRLNHSPSSIMARLKSRLSKDSGFLANGMSAGVELARDRKDAPKKQSKLIKKKRSVNIKSAIIHKPSAIGSWKKPSTGQGVDLLASVANAGDADLNEFDADASVLAEQKLFDRVHDISSSISIVNSKLAHTNIREVYDNSVELSSDSKLSKPRSHTQPMTALLSPGSVPAETYPSTDRETDPAITYQNLIEPVPLFEASEPSASKSDLCVRLSLDQPWSSFGHESLARTNQLESVEISPNLVHPGQSGRPSDKSERALADVALIDDSPTFEMERELDISRYQSISSQFYSTCASRPVRYSGQRDRITELSEETVASIFNPTEYETEYAGGRRYETEFEILPTNEQTNAPSAAPTEALPDRSGQTNAQPGHSRAVSNSGSSLHLHKMRISQHLRSLSSLSDVSSRVAPTISTFIHPRNSTTQEDCSHGLIEQALESATNTAANARAKQSWRGALVPFPTRLGSIVNSSDLYHGAEDPMLGMDSTIENITTTETQASGTGLLRHVAELGTESSPSTLDTSAALKQVTELGPGCNHGEHKFEACPHRDDEFQNTSKSSENSCTKATFKQPLSLEKNASTDISNRHSLYDGVVETPVDALSSSIVAPSIEENYNDAALMWEKALRTHQYQQIERRRKDQHNHLTAEKSNRSESRKQSGSSRGSGYDPFDVECRNGRSSSDFMRIELKRINTEHSFSKITIPGGRSASRRPSSVTSLSQSLQEGETSNESRLSAVHKSQSLHPHTQRHAHGSSLRDEQSIFRKDFGFPESTSTRKHSIPKITVTKPKAMSQERHSQDARIRPSSTLRAWSRYPSHTREARCLSAGMSDNIIARDFAPTSLLNGRVNELNADCGSSGTERKLKMRRVKAKSLLLKGRILELRSLFKSRSMALFRKGERGHRSSIALGGKLDYPELELLPHREPRVSSMLNASHLATGGDANTTEILIPSIDQTIATANKNSKDMKDETRIQLSANRPAHADHARLVSSQYSSEHSEDEEKGNHGFGSLNLAVMNDGDTKQRRLEEKHERASALAAEYATVCRSVTNDAFENQQRRMRRSTQDLCQRLDTEEKTFLADLRDD